MPNKSYTTPKRLAHLQDRYDAVLAKCIKDIEALGFVPSGEIVPHVRVTSNKHCMGTCRRSQRLEFHEKGYDVAFVFTISCTCALADKEDALYDTMYHEVIHTLPNCANHGVEFKRVMRKVNAALGTHIATTYDAATYSDEKPITVSDVIDLIGVKVETGGRGVCTFRGINRRAPKYPCELADSRGNLCARVTPKYLVDNIVSRG